MFFAQDENEIKSNNFLFDGNLEFKNDKFPWPSITIESLFY